MNQYIGEPPFPKILKCSWCGVEKERMAILKHPSGEVLFLCFRGCQHFLEPYKKTGLSFEWERIDPWFKQRSQPRLRHSR